MQLELCLHERGVSPNPTGDSHPADIYFSRLHVVPQHACPHVVCVNRYLLFTYYAGRPLGGMKDYLDSFESVEEALDNILDESGRYYQIVDSATMEIVKEGLARFKSFSPGGFTNS